MRRAASMVSGAVVDHRAHPPVALVVRVAAARVLARTRVVARRLSGAVAGLGGAARVDLTAAGAAACIALVALAVVAGRARLGARGVRRAPPVRRLAAVDLAAHGPVAGVVGLALAGARVGPCVAACRMRGALPVAVLARVDLCTRAAISRIPTVTFAPRAPWSKIGAVCIFVALSVMLLTIVHCHTGRSRT